MQFRTPQFIEIEDKIFGPFTFKQFIYMLGGIFMAYISFKALPLLIGVPLGLGGAALAAALAFYKVNNRPFITVLQAWVKYKIASKLYIWHKASQKASSQATAVKKKAGQEPEKLSGSRLKDLSWSLDVIDATKNSNL